MNNLKGTFEFELGGKIRTFKTGTNQTAIFESITGLSLNEYVQVFQNPEKYKMQYIRDLIYSCLEAGVRYTKEPLTFSTFDVGDWIDEAPENAISDIFEKIAGLSDVKKKGNSQ